MSRALATVASLVIFGAACTAWRPIDLRSTPDPGLVRIWTAQGSRAVWNARVSPDSVLLGESPRRTPFSIPLEQIQRTEQQYTNVRKFVTKAGFLVAGSIFGVYYWLAEHGT